MPKNTSSAAALSSSVIPEPVYNSDMNLAVPAKLGSVRLPRKIKAAVLRDLLLQPAGARLHGLMSATGWQAHTVPAALSSLRKSGVEIIKTTRDAGTVYTASAPAAAPATPAAGKATPPRAQGKNPADSCARTRLSVATADATKPELLS